VRNETPDEAVVDVEELAPGLVARRIRRRNDRALVLEGEIDVSCARSLLSWLEHEIADGDGPIVVDLAAVSFIDSSGVAALLTARTAAGPRMRVGEIHPTVRRVFEIAAVIDRLTIDTALTEMPDHQSDGVAGRG
jgi:anti-anti-sigma factor